MGRVKKIKYELKILKENKSIKNKKYIQFF